MTNRVNLYLFITSQFDVKKESRVFRPNSFPDCPLAPQPTAPTGNIQLFHSCTVESVCTLHLCVAAQETLHHKFNPCATTDSIPHPASKCNQIFPDSRIADSVLLHAPGFLVSVQRVNGVCSGRTIKFKLFTVFSFEFSRYKNLL